MIRVGIIGASGYAGAELTRYLLAHPGVEITYLASKTSAGNPLSDAYPSFLGRGLPICEEYDVEKAADKADFFFQAVSNGSGMQVAPELLEFGKKIIDIPADFRIKDAGVYKQYYGIEHTALELLAEAVYGIPELHADEIAKARIVANPGCYATSAILALAPLLSKSAVETDSIIIDSKSGVSGAGRSKIEVTSLFCEINEGFKAYAVATHRHVPEIEQELSWIAGNGVLISFTPHLVPMNRGILSTAYAKPLKAMTTADAVTLYKEFYKDKPFVIVLDEGKQPNTKNVVGTNYCHIGVVSDARTGRLVVTCAIDNMGKGAAGQAVQNMNIMNGFDENAGLTAVAVYP